LRFRHPRGRVLVLAAAAALAASAWAGTAAASAGRGLTPIPARVFAPYFEAYLPTSVSKIARQSGARYLTLAFIQTPKKGSCTATWNGKPRSHCRRGTTWPRSPRRAARAAT